MYWDELEKEDLVEGIPNELLAGWLREIRKDEAKEAVLTTMCMDISHIIPIVAADDELLQDYPEAHEHILECAYCWDKYMDASCKRIAEESDKIDKWHEFIEAAQNDTLSDDQIDWLLTDIMN